jgi:hypothetical protein
MWKRYKYGAHCTIVISPIFDRNAVTRTFRTFPRVTA